MANSSKPALLIKDKTMPETNNKIIYTMPFFISLKFLIIHKVKLNHI